MLEIKLTVALEKEDRAILAELATGLRSLGGAITPAVPAPVEKKKATKAEKAEAPKAPEPRTEVKPEPVKEAPAETAPVAPSEPVEAPEKAQAKEYTLEDVRARVMAISRRGAEYKDKVKAALNKYAESVPKLNKSDYPAFMADLEAI